MHLQCTLIQPLTDTATPILMQPPLWLTLLIVLVLPLHIPILHHAIVICRTHTMANMQPMFEHT